MYVTDMPVYSASAEITSSTVTPPTGVVSVGSGELHMPVSLLGVAIAAVNSDANNTNALILFMALNDW